MGFMLSWKPIEEGDKNKDLALNSFTIVLFLNHHKTRRKMTSHLKTQILRNNDIPL